MSVSQIRPNVWIGSWEPAHDPAFLTTNKITSILNVAIDHDDPEVVPGLRRYKVPVIDGPGNPLHVIAAAVVLTTWLLRAGENILIHCIAGHSRSVYIAAKALEIVEGRPYDEIWDGIFKIRPEITNPQRLRPLYH